MSRACQRAEKVVRTDAPHVFQGPHLGLQGHIQWSCPSPRTLGHHDFAGEGDWWALKDRVARGS